MNIGLIADHIGFYFFLNHSLPTRPSGISKKWSETDVLFTKSDRDKTLDTVQSIMLCTRKENVYSKPFYMRTAQSRQMSNLERAHKKNPPEN